MTEDQLTDDDLEIIIPENIDFEIGDHVVYPHHGAGMVLKKELRKMFGEEREYLTIKILHNDMTVMVPCENAGIAGLRRIIDEEMVKKVLTVLRDDISEMPKNWNRRFKHNRDKIKTGDIYELAEVVRNLAIREHEKGLSTGEKQMYTRAKKILASELMYALEKSEDEAESVPRRPPDRVRGLEGPFGQLATMLSAVALLVAGGRGERLGSDGPKAFVVCGGRPMLEWSLDALAAGGPDGGGRRAAGGRSRRPRARSVSPGGEQRSHSVRNALAAAGPAADVVLVHDAARPLVTAAIVIRDCLAAMADGVDAAIAAAPIADTVKEAGTERLVLRTLDRSRLWAVQTPQVFRREMLERVLCPARRRARGGDRRRVARRGRGRYRCGSCRRHAATSR